MCDSTAAATVESTHSASLWLRQETRPTPDSVAASRRHEIEANGQTIIEHHHRRTRRWTDVSHRATTAGGTTTALWQFGRISSYLQIVTSWGTAQKTTAAWCMRDVCTLLRDDRISAKSSASKVEYILDSFFRQSPSTYQRHELKSKLPSAYGVLSKVSSFRKRLSQNRTLLSTVKFRNVAVCVFTFARKIQNTYWSSF